MNKFFITLHRWLGFPLGLLFVITFGTGCLTAIEELVERFKHAKHNTYYNYQTISNHDLASAIELITEDKQSITSITIPTENTPYYRVASQEESWTYAIDNISHGTHKENNDDGFFRTVLQLHRNFLLGKDRLFGIEGKFYAVWVGLIALLISLLGLWIWWPLRKSFKAKDVLPRGNKRKHYYYSHMTSGVITLFAVALLSLTGAAITYRSFAQQLFTVDPNTPSQFQPKKLNNDWQTWIRSAYVHMPEKSQLTQIRYPRQSKTDSQQQAREQVKKERVRTQNNRDGAEKQDVTQTFSLHFTSPGDWFGLDRSIVKIDKRTSTLIDVSRFEDLPLNQKIYSILVPLHTGHDLPVFYVALLFVFSFMGTVMVLSGLVSFIIKKRKWLKRSSQTLMAPVVE